MGPADIFMASPLASHSCTSGTFLSKTAMKANYSFEAGYIYFSRYTPLHLSTFMLLSGIFLHQIFEEIYFLVLPKSSFPSEKILCMCLKLVSIKNYEKREINFRFGTPYYTATFFC